MIDCSLLFPEKRDFEKNLDERVISDLSIDTIAEAINFDAEKMSMYLLDFSATEEELLFRHEIADDFIRNAGLFNALIHKKTEFEIISEKTNAASKEIHSMQYLREPTTDWGGNFTIVAIFHVVSEALKSYWSFFDDMLSILENKGLRSKGLERLKNVLNNIISGNDIEKLRTEISDYTSLTSLSSSYSCVLHLNRSLHIEKMSYETIGTVQRDLRNRGKQKKCIDVKMSDRALNRMLFNHNKSYAVKLLEMAKYYQRILENMYDDLQFYELYVGIIKFYETNGIPVSLIKNLSEKDLRFTDLFDLSLVADVVVKGKDVRKNVKSNSADIITKKVFISGMNQGGKTVFIRSVGIAVLLAKAGLPVPAEQFVCSNLNSIYTFFPIDDIVYEANSRFRNELAMMKKIVEKAPYNSLVLMNEPFISTTEKEAVALIENLLVFFNRHNNCVITVTHFKQLLSKIDASAQSFVASGYPSFSVSEASPYLLTGHDLLPFLE